MQTSEKEIRDLTKAWLAISLAFAIVMDGLSTGIFNAFLISALTVGAGFILHELAHKYTAQKLCCSAEFRSFDNMLIFALLMSLAGFVLAAPGAVMIRGNADRRQNGRISASGIVANLFVALVFLFILTISEGTLRNIASYGLIINSWLALFNLIPFGGFDGSKVLAWSKPVYLLLAFMALSLLFSRAFI